MKILSKYQCKKRCRGCSHLIAEDGKEPFCNKYNTRIVDATCNGPTESARLAQRIWEIETADIKQRKKWMSDNVDSWDIGDCVRLVESDDNLVWYLWKTKRDLPRRYLKVIPKGMWSIDYIERLLEVEFWNCI